MSLQSDTRGQGLIQVLLLLVVSFVGIWIFFIIAGAFFEPLADIIHGFDQMEEQGYTNALEMLMTTLTVWAPTLFGLGMIALVIIYAVFREQFQGTRRPGP